MHGARASRTGREKAGAIVFYLHGGWVACSVASSVPRWRRKKEPTMKTTTPRVSKNYGLAATYRSIARWQSKGRTCAVVSLGQDVDLTAVRNAGGLVAKLLVSMPDTAEQVREIVSALRRSGCVDRCYVLGAAL